MHIVAQSYKAATVIETYAAVVAFDTTPQRMLTTRSNRLFPSQVLQETASCGSHQTLHQKSIYFKLKETLRNTTNKSMRSTDKMRNCHLMDGMATWLILADQINIKDLFKINITFLKNTATVFKRKSLEQLS